MSFLQFADYNKLLETQVTYENYPWKGGSWEPWLPANQYKVILALCSYIAEKMGFIIWVIGDAIAIVLCQAMKNTLLILKDDIRRTFTQCPNERTAFAFDEKAKLSQDPINVFANKPDVNGYMHTSTAHLSIPMPAKSADVHWEQIRNRYMYIMELFENMGKFVYPLILSCYFINIFFVIDNVK